MKKRDGHKLCPLKAKKSMANFGNSGQRREDKKGPDPDIC